LHGLIIGGSNKKKGGQINMTQKNKDEWTMIRVKKKTLASLRKQKVHKNQSDDEILSFIVQNLKSNN
jgi:hypothetical protein